jgi:hypothetical protein
MKYLSAKEQRRIKIQHLPNQKADDCGGIHMVIT